MHRVSSWHGGLKAFVACEVAGHWYGAGRSRRGAGAGPRALVAARLSVVHVVTIIVHHARHRPMRWRLVALFVVVSSLSLGRLSCRLPICRSRP